MGFHRTAVVPCTLFPCRPVLLLQFLVHPSGTSSAGLIGLLHATTGGCCRCSHAARVQLASKIHSLRRLVSTDLSPLPVRHHNQRIPHLLQEAMLQHRGSRAGMRPACQEVIRPVELHCPASASAWRACALGNLRCVPHEHVYRVARLRASVLVLHKKTQSIAQSLAHLKLAFGGRDILGNERQPAL